MANIDLRKIRYAIEHKEEFLNKEFIMKNRKILIKTACIVLAVFCILYITAGDGNDERLIQGESVTETEEEPADDDYGLAGESGFIIVDISGAVRTPMVIKLPEGSRIDDAINGAGGLTDKADISEVNRAQILEDGQKILIPEKNADQGGKQISSGSAVTDTISNEKVNINTADADLLETITGVGPATAEKIIRYRNSEGPFRKIEDIQNVSGIGSKTFEKMKDEITV